MDFLNVLAFVMGSVLRDHCLHFKHSSEDFCKLFLGNEPNTQSSGLAFDEPLQSQGLKTLVEEYTWENKGCEHNFNLSHLCQF